MIFKYDRESGKITASMPVDNATQVYDCLPTVCMNPFCDCNDVFMDLQRLGETHHLGIDLEEKALIERENVSIIDEFSTQLFDLLDESDFNFLNVIYLSQKRYASEKADASELEIEFSQEEIEQKNLMIGYNNLFPYENRFDVTVKSTLYILEDHYCLKNKCSCNETIFRCYSLPNKTADEYIGIQLGNGDFSIRVNYQLKNWTFVDKPQDGSLDTSQVRAALENKCPDFYAQVQLRHQRLRLLYSDYLKTPQPTKKTKIGRNDSCPCGSGKKYKKCCGLGGTLLA